MNDRVVVMGSRKTSGARTSKQALDAAFGSAHVIFLFSTEVPQLLSDAPPCAGRVVDLTQLHDPTRNAPWGVAQLTLFKDAAMEAAESVREGKKVLFLCVGGANRSVALARAATRLALHDSDWRKLTPSDGSMQHMADAIDEGDNSNNDIKQLAPLQPATAVGKRGRF